MLRHLLATTAILIALGAPAFAEEPATGTTDQTTATGTTAQAGPTATDSEAQETVKPDPDGATGMTQGGGITPTAKEILPNTDDEAAIDPRETDETGAPEMGEATGAGTGGNDVVSAEILREVREMALEAERKAAAPPETKTDEAITAERQAIERHRTAFFDRTEQGS